ncbi:hypothetical protein NPIL_166771 [Nephila pilipes]|uniref:Uncharacterized protein n=1 Tax=Nephila pilipes TaxID=299642 RepID=A0A8X6N8Z4_NEPPI|nr:hypothetical protein NPIL_166771 [Nephila pilipes]
MSIKVVSGMEKTDLQKVSMDSENYDDELMREMLEGIKEVIERREPLEAKKRSAKTEFLMEEMYILVERSQYLIGIKYSTELQDMKTQIREIEARIFYFESEDASYQRKL